LKCIIDGGVAMRTQYKKVIEDLFDNLSKTVMVILAIALGVFGLGIIIDSYCITDREMTASYEETNPASFVIAVDNPDDILMNTIQTSDDIQQIELRKTIIVRVGTETDAWYQAKIYVVSDWEHIDISTFYSLDGENVPKKGEILLEYSSLSVVDLTIGDSMNVKMPGTSTQELNIVGSVQADGTNPAWMHEEVLGYICEDTMYAFGAEQKSCEILVTISANKADKAHITKVSEYIRNEIESLGYKVNYVSVPTPNVHPNAAQMNAILLLFRIFGTLSLLLSSILVFSIVTSILKGQVRQIAIMKSMGATTRQISQMYYLFVMILGIVAAILAIPSAKVMSASLCKFTATILVFTVRNYSVPIWVYVLQFVIAVLIPMLAATFPIRKGSRISINEGLHDNRININQFGRRKIEKLFSKASIRNAGVSMGLRNTFRKPTRLLFAVFTLAIGGAILMASINVRVSLEESFSQTLDMYEMDTQFVFFENYSDSIIEDILQEIDGVESFISTVVSHASLIDEAEGERTNIIYDNSELMKEITIRHKPLTDLDTTYRKTEEVFRENGIDVISSLTIKGAEVIYEKHLYTVASFLIGASVIVILVGIISLISLAGMSVTERMKELGIMRSFGTNARSVFLVVYVENLLTGLLGFSAAVLMAIPLSTAIGKQFGEIFLNKALPNVFSTNGLLLWLALTIIINTLVSFLAVKKAIKLPVYEILAYE